MNKYNEAIAPVIDFLSDSIKNNETISFDPHMLQLLYDIINLLVKDLDYSLNEITRMREVLEKEISQRNLP